MSFGAAPSLGLLSAARKRNWTDRRVLGAEAVRQWLAGEGRGVGPKPAATRAATQRQNKRKRCVD